MRILLALLLSASSLFAQARQSTLLLLNTGGSAAYVAKDSQSTNNDFDDFADAAARENVGSSFTAGSSYTIRRVELLLYRLGSPTFTFTVSIYADSGGVPTGAALCTSTETFDSSTLGTTAATVTANFSTGTALTSGTKYHIVLDSSAVGDGSNDVRWRINYNTVSGQSITSYNGAVWSTRYASSQAVFTSYAFE